MRVVARLQTTLTTAIIFPFSIYKYPYNINQEEHATYLKRVGKAEKQLDALATSSQLPRRRRRVYDRPKHDIDTTNYTAWRLYDPDEMMDKLWAHGATVVAKLQLQPKWVIHAFGTGLLPLNHSKSASLEFSFEDNNFSKFLLYDYRSTTNFLQNDPKYDYANQQSVPEKRRKVFRLTPEQFWKSQEHFEFRLNCTAYAEHLKFKKWVEEKVESWKSKESYDSFIDKKYGTVLNYNKKEDTARFTPYKPAILSLTPSHFTLPKKGDKLKQAKVDLPKRLGEQHRVKEKEKGDVAQGERAAVKSS